jgi:hypothetical protein
MQEVVSQAVAAGIDVRLWALDQVDESLRAWTVGAGSGEKFPLIGRLIDDVPAEAWLVVMDDDVEFTTGSLTGLLETMSRAQLDLAQPAHDFRSYVSHPPTVAAPFSIARRCRFVEIGPIFVVAPRARGRVLGDVADRGMGYGLEAAWATRTREAGLRTGIVDCIRVRHLKPVATAYDAAPMRVAAAEQLPAAGAATWRDLYRTEAIWRPWQRVPPW